MGDKRAPAEAQRKRVRWEESEQRNERVFAYLGGNEGYGVCDDEAQGRCEKAAGERAGVVNAPARPLLPAVRAVCGAFK